MENGDIRSNVSAVRQLEILMNLFQWQDGLSGSHSYHFAQIGLLFY